MTNPGSLNRYAYVQNDPINFIDPSGQSLKSFVGSVASKVSSTAKSVASTAKSVAKSVASTSKSTASSAYTSANSAAQAAQAAAKASATSAATAKANNAASMAYMYANEARMTGSGISGYGNYASSYTGYYNSSYETGKIPSTDAPRIKDVDEGTLKYCASGLKQAASNTVVSIQVIVWDKINSGGEYEGFKEQALNSPYFDSSDKNNVKIVYVETAQEFVDAWNSADQAQQLYIYAHSGSGRRSGDGVLIFENQAISFKDDVNIHGKDDEYMNYSYDHLKEIDVNHIYLFSCHGAAYGVDNNIAVELAERSGAVVTANTGSVSFSNIFGDYYARSGGSVSDLGIWKMISVDESGNASWTLQWPLNFIGGEVK